MRARIWIALVAGCLAGLFSMAQGAGAATLQPVGTFNNPIFMTSPPGDPRLFVVERGGTIEVVHDGVQSQFLDIHDLTTEEGERGLLSMAFDPNYAKNGLFYVFYTGTAAADGQTGLGHVDEFHASSNPNVANRASLRHVLTFTRPSPVASNHNGGQLQFGRDGLLYISVGDGGTGGSTAPNLALLNGKILRVDPHGAAPGAYSIPAGNPYATSGFARHEIWASGFRNPWRFSFDAATGDLTIGDVGESSWEEIDLAPAPAIGRGANFGWPACEGFAGSCPGATLPVFAYPHQDPGGDVAHGCAIMGGYVYRGTQIPALAGRYLYADLCAGELRSIKLGIPFAGDDRAESAPGALSSPQSFGEDASCNLYVTNGNVVDKLVGPPSSAKPACPANPTKGWTVTPTPVISGQAKALYGVDCSSANSCMAVGDLTAGTLNPLDSHPIVERWDGTSWQIMPTPDSFGLHGISCPRANFCFAVGSRDLIERWDGTSWSIQPSPAVPGGTLADIDCSGLLACTAVGSVATGTLGPTGPNTRTLAERWDATGWHVQSTPNPAGSDSSQLSSVSCPLKRTCTAVGQSTAGGVGSPLVERWFGRVNSWGLQSAPKPEGAASAALSGVSCPDGPACFAVGSSSATPGTLAERRVGSTWSVMPTPNPPPSGLPPQLYGVSCPRLRACHAVGFGFGSPASVFAERFDGASWQLEAVPTNGSPSPRLFDVSCPSRFFCMSVGNQLGGGATLSTLAAKWTP
jgi:hypothetical protein